MSVRKVRYGKETWWCADMRAIGLGQHRYRTREEAQTRHDEKMRLYEKASAAQVPSTSP